MLKHVLPKLGVQEYQFIVFEGKQDLQKRLNRILQTWQEVNCIFLVVQDQDSGDCYKIKSKLVSLCTDTSQEVMIRIACRELESFYLGDLAAVEQGLDLPGISRHQDKRKFRDPDRLGNPVQELSALTKNAYQKVLGSRKISPYLNLNNNKSRSFNVLIKGITRLVECTTST
jgi:hypothetical protein